MNAKLILIAGLAVSAPHAVYAQDAAANADGYAKSVCSNGGYANPHIGYLSYEECYSSEFAKYLDWYPQDNGGSDPSPGYNPTAPVNYCSGRIDCN